VECHDSDNADSHHCVSCLCTEYADDYNVVYASEQQAYSTACETRQIYHTRSFKLVILNKDFAGLVGCVLMVLSAQAGYIMP